MKWAKTKSELDQIRKRLLKLGPDAHNLGKNPSRKLVTSIIESEIEQYYEELNDNPTLDDLCKKGFGEWLAVPKNQMPLKYEHARARYETFVGGYLYYFEKYASQHRSDRRVIFFDWGKINKKAGLTVFLSPLHIEEARKIMPNNDSPGNENYNVYSDISHNGDGNHYDTQNAQETKVTTNKMDKKLREMSIAPPPTRDQTDPPPPPPPPPPPRE